MTYNEHTFYCMGNTEQIGNQIIEYSKRHREDTIDSILKNQDEE